MVDGAGDKIVLMFGMEMSYHLSSFHPGKRMSTDERTNRNEHDLRAEIAALREAASECGDMVDACDIVGL